MGALGGSATALIDAPLDVLWAIVRDVESAPEWQRGIESVEALERDADGLATLAEICSNAKVRMIRSRARFTYEPPVRVAWVQEKGDLKSFAGAWELEDIGDGRTRATYRLDADPGTMLGMLLRGGVADRLRSTLVTARPAELQARAGKG